MIEEEIERAAQEVLEAHGLTGLPVDPFAIARLEGIALLPGKYDRCFDGRIEYRRRDGRGRFYLFYAEEESGWRPEGRVRFSIAHELAHFYLEEHRQYLLSGVWHASNAGFVSEKRTEREADQFAAALLIPRARFQDLVATKSGQVCDMQELVDLADRTFRTSMTCTVIRYVQLNFEPCCVVLSGRGRRHEPAHGRHRVLFSIASDDLRRQGLGWIDPGSVVPATSMTGKVLASLAEGEEASTSGTVEADVWFEARPSRDLWEEVKVLGKTGLTLTFLAVAGDGED